MLNSKILEPFRILVPDLPGHGNSDRNASYSLPYWGNIISLFVSQLTHGDVIGFGHSLGGHVLIQSLKFNPNCFRGLIIAGSPPLTNPPNLDEGFNAFPAAAVLFDSRPEKEAVERFFETQTFNSAHQKILMEEYWKTDPKIRTDIQKTVSNGLYENGRSLLSNWNRYTALMVGEKDPLINKKYLEKVSNSLGPLSAFEILSDCGHYLSLDAPERSARRIAELTSRIVSS